MKKSLLALAVLGAFAGAASAQTNVTIYGVVDAGITRTVTDTEDYTTDAIREGHSTVGLGSGIQSGSRLGFRGTEDLGGGLSAVFTLENGFNTDTGTLGQSNATTQRLFGRQAWVGLNGGFGSVKLGRQITPIKTALEAIDPFQAGLAGDIQQTFNEYGQRMDNTISYSLPNIAGFSGQVAYGFGEVPGAPSRSRQVGAAFGYANGPITVALGYHTTSNGTAAATATNEPRTVLLGGAFDFGVAKVHAAFADNRGDAKLADIATTFTSGVTAGTPAGTAFAADLAAIRDEDFKTRDYMLGVSAPLGAGTIMGSWLRKDLRIDGTDDDNYDVLALGYSHNVSKRTNLYTSFGYGKTEGITGDLKTNTFNVGVRHKF